MEQESVLGAAAVFVIAAIYSRLATKYGEERSVRYAHLERATLPKFAAPVRSPRLS